MKYVIAALLVCMLAGALLVLSDPPGGHVPVPAQVSPAQESAVAVGAPPDAPCPEPEKNTAPRVQASIHCEGLSCRFDAAASSDDRAVRGYRWSLDDGVDATEAVASHTYAAPGLREVSLSAIDDCGLAESRTVTLELADGGNFGCEACFDAKSPVTPSYSGFSRDRHESATPGMPRRKTLSGGTAKPSPAAESPSDAPQE